MTSSKISSAPAAIARGPQAFEEPGRRRDQAHVGGDRLDDDAGHVVVDLGHDVVGHDHRLGHRVSGTPAEPGRPRVAMPLPPAASRPSLWPW